MKLHILASGSSGNSILVEAGPTLVLVDCGLSGAEAARRMESVGIDAGEIGAILVSHEHGDHLQGVGVLARRHQIPVYLTPGTMGACNGQLSGRADCRVIEAGREFEIDGLRIHAFAIPHDAAEPVGFTFRQGGLKAGVATDVGFSTALVRQHLMGCNLLVLESNHDPEMLRNGPYPWELKRRISGRSGHLSNEDAGRLLERVLHRDLREVVLAHLSEKNNSPGLARSAAEAVLTRYRMHETVKIQVASQRSVVSIGAGAPKPIIGRSRNDTEIQPS